MSAILAGTSLALLVIVLVLVALVKKMQKGTDEFYKENLRLRDLIGWEKK